MAMATRMAAVASSSSFYPNQTPTFLSPHPTVSHLFGLSYSSSHKSSPGRLQLKVAATAKLVMDQETQPSSLPTTVDVHLGDRSYPIYIGSGLLDQPHLLQRSPLYFFLIGFEILLCVCV